jgi:SpoVK/Ycf46/Vps4 family AAA+-type ATPase
MANSLVDQTINAFKVLIDALSTVDAATGAYSAASDRVIVFVTALGQVVMTCDGRIDAGEAARLAQILSPLKAKALTVQLLRSLQHPATPATAAAPASKPEIETGDPLLELHNLIGLSSVKVEVETLANLAKVFTLRKTKGLPVPDFSFHLVFSGNPGTGKTTVARIIARIYKQLGLLTQGHLVEVDRSGLVANYVGQTATKVQDVVAKAMGGVLFIDEAYALSAGGQNDFGQEAIETLLKAMEDHRDNLIVIVAGYTDKMIGFLQSNPGLKSRFPKTIQFPDYTAPEMDAIFQKFCADAHYKVDDDALPVVASCLQHCWDARGADFANARDVRNIFEAAIAAQANRLGASSALTDQQLTVLTRDDIIAAQASS